MNIFSLKVLSSISSDIYNDNKGRKVIICHLTKEKDQNSHTQKNVLEKKLSLV